MKNKNPLYFVLDAIFIAGIILSSFNLKDYDYLVPLFAVIFIITLIHQVYDEKKYFSGMFDAGRPAAIQGWIFARWLLTIFALLGFIALVYDFYFITIK